MLGFFTELLNQSIQAFDSTLQDVAPHQLVLATGALYFLYNQYQDPWIFREYRARHNKSYQQRVIDIVYGLGKDFKPVKQYVAKELEKNLASTRETLAKQRQNMHLQDKMPEKGVPCVDILKEFEIDAKECTYDFAANKKEDKDFKLNAKDGKDSGALYAAPSKEYIELHKEVYGATSFTNLMHDKWSRMSAMLAEVISWGQELFHGSKDGYGLVTHGGTTSIIEAMAAYVIDARARGIKNPEIVVPETAHEAFRKAAILTGATLVIVPVDPLTGAVTAREMRKYISGNTAVIVGSAPSFMNGIEDPVADLGHLALEMKVPLHVDACLGGFLTAHLNTDKNPLDFRVPGVCSISADTHKYGLCPKGSSMLLFSKDSPALAVHAALGWQGGLYTTAGRLDGSTCGARVAEIYSTFSYHGKEKYRQISESIVNLRAEIQEKIAKLYSHQSKQDIYVYGEPKFSVLGFRSDTFNPHLIADELDKKGWKLSLLQSPAGFHLCLTHVHTLVNGFADNFVKDLDEAIKTVKSYPADKKPSGNVKVYGAIGTMPSEVQEEVCIGYQKARLGFIASKIGHFANDKKEPTSEPYGGMELQSPTVM